MNLTLGKFAALALLAVGLAVGAPVQAVTITYQATDLADTTPGEDLWRYSYSVSGSFVAFGGFNIFFGPALYRALENPPLAVNGDWLVTTLEPDPGLPADGLYTGTALVDNPSVADLFTVDFVWLGRGAPGSQPFEVFDDSFSILQTSQTSAPGQQDLPLPGTLALVALGVAGIRVRHMVFARQRV